MTFFKSESGAVTVDWVVLTAALVGLGLATMSVVSSGAQDISQDIEGQLKSDGIIQAAFAPEILATIAGVDLRNSNYTFATPRCVVGDTPDTCYSFYDYTVVLEDAEGETYTMSAREANKSEVEYTATVQNSAGDDIPLNQIDFGGTDCVDVENYAGTPREVCVSNYL